MLLFVFYTRFLLTSLIFITFAVMKLSGFKNHYVLSHLLAMILTFFLLIVGISYALDFYTHHGEEISIPNVKNMDVDAAEKLLDEAGLVLVVRDTGYVRTLPPDCILEQTPVAGEKVKGGRVVYVTINSASSPTITLPDVIDNSSFREAMAKLKAMGFKVGQPQFVPGEHDWVYGILVKGKHVAAGDRVSVDDILVIQVGNGQRDIETDYNMVGSTDVDIPEDGGLVDDFEEVSVPDNSDQ